MTQSVNSKTFIDRPVNNKTFIDRPVNNEIGVRMKEKTCLLGLLVEP
jgi:hypothetical protein